MTADAHGAAPGEAVDLVAIGHVTLDRTPTGIRPGGAAYYAALTAHRLGLRVGPPDLLRVGLSRGRAARGHRRRQRRVGPHHRVRGRRARAAAGSSRSSRAPPTSRRSGCPRSGGGAALALLCPIIGEVDPGPLRRLHRRLGRRRAAGVDARAGGERRHHRRAVVGRRPRAARYPAPGGERRGRRRLREGRHRVVPAGARRRADRAEAEAPRSSSTASATTSRRTGRRRWMPPVRGTSSPPRF